MPLFVKFGKVIGLSLSLKLTRKTGIYSDCKTSLILLLMHLFINICIF